MVDDMNVVASPMPLAWSLVRPCTPFLYQQECQVPNFASSNSTISGSSFRKSGSTSPSR
jgi:hypothetical protein